METNKTTLTLMLSILCLNFLIASAQSSDTQAPRITLASSLTEITKASTVYLAAVASDNEGIDRIEFFQDNQKLGERSEAPFALGASLDASNNGTVIFTAIAYDAAGNNTLSNTVNVNVVIAETAPQLETPTPQETPATPTVEEIPETPKALSATNDLFETFINTPLIAGQDYLGKAAIRVSAGVLGNDTALSATVRAPSSISGGLLSMNDDGSFSFFPELGFIGETSFEYELTSDSESVTASVSILVKEANPDLTDVQSIWYVNSLRAGGNGTASNPFASLEDAEAASSEGDIIYVAAGSYNCESVCFTLKDNQQLLGEGSLFRLQEQTIAAAGRPANLNANGNAGIVLAHNSSVQGLNISSSSIGVFGEDTLEGDILLTDLTIPNAVNFGIRIDETDATDSTTGGKHNLSIRNVNISNPGKMGIVSNDAANLTLHTVNVSGVQLNPDDRFSGRGIQIESEFNTVATVTNTNISSSTDGSDSASLTGLYILKNNAFGNASTATTLSVNVSNTNISFSPTSSNTVGYAARVFAGNDTFPADTGTLQLSGGNNTVAAATIADFSTGSAVVSGSVDIAGIVYP